MPEPGHIGELASQQDRIDDQEHDRRANRGEHQNQREGRGERIVKERSPCSV